MTKPGNNRPPEAPEENIGNTAPRLKRKPRNILNFEREKARLRGEVKQPTLRDFYRLQEDVESLKERLGAERAQNRRRMSSLLDQPLPLAKDEDVAPLKPRERFSSKTDTDTNDDLLLTRRRSKTKKSAEKQPDRQPENPEPESMQVRPAKDQPESAPAATQSPEAEPKPRVVDIVKSIDDLYKTYPKKEKAFKAELDVYYQALENLEFDTVTDSADGMVIELRKLRARESQGDRVFTLSHRNSVTKAEDALLEKMSRSYDNTLVRLKRLARQKRLEKAAWKASGKNDTTSAPSQAVWEICRELGYGPLDKSTSSWDAYALKLELNNLLLANPELINNTNDVLATRQKTLRMFVHRLDGIIGKKGAWMIGMRNMVRTARPRLIFGNGWKGLKASDVI